MRRRLAPFTFVIAIFLLTALATAHGQINRTATQTAGWTQHTDPRGFAIATPPGWTLNTDTSGRIVVRGTRGEQAIVWPVSIDQRRLDLRGVEGLLQQLARQIDPQLGWSAPAVSGNALRVFAKTPQRNAAAAIIWTANSAGTAAVFYCLEAPPAIYAASTDAFSGVLQSFHAIAGPASQNAAAAPLQAISYVNWTDPRENAFTISVPQGWRIAGGAYRLAPTDIRVGVVAGSPDGQIRVLLGDSNLGTFIEPSQMLAYAGLREGMYYGLGDGSRLLISRYLSGQQFARVYAQMYVTRMCSGLQVTANNQRGDLTDSFLQSARAEGMPSPQLTAGDVSFTCNVGGTAVRGTVVTATILPFPGNASIWYVYRMYGYLAVPAREQEAAQIALRGAQSFRINPQWQAQQQQIANQAVAADNLRSQQIQQRAMAAIQEDQRQTSDIIMKGWEQRSAVYDEISRKRENAILGTLDVVDPETGTQYKVSNYSDYHWMNNEGVIAGNNTGNSPGPDWREIVTLP
jgi:hypothetical protein